MALALNAEKVLFPVVGALMANTIPSAQWSPCLQYTQIGLV